ncbi:hypothetical protein AB1Y20_005743 [Prymnesium parvum]|uniref:Carrier domain-containing protein n=1 Tax=Prymnesium parvum TaxID=97485 RepID=A0AB34J2I0_PRYPA
MYSLCWRLKPSRAFPLLLFLRRFTPALLAPFSASILLATPHPASYSTFDPPPGSAASLVFMGGAKRGFVETDELISLRNQLLGQLSIHLNQDPASLDDAISSSAKMPTLLELGLSSAACSALKGWVFHNLEAELTTFELLKTPMDQLLELIARARTRTIGLPELPAPQPRREQGNSASGQ